MPSIRDTIARVAEEEGIDPAYALAVAERESKFDPSARASKSIAGLFQMQSGLRRKYGAGDSLDPEEQTRAFARFTHDLRGEMADKLGRDPTHGEVYTGHHLGGSRAARIASGEHAGYAPSDLFSAREMAGNPHFGKARTGGELSQSIVGDIDRRMAKFGGGALPNEAPNSGGRNGSGVDFASFGQPVDGELPGNYGGNNPVITGNKPAIAGNSRAIDFAAFGQPADSTREESGKNLPAGQAIDFAAFGAPAEAKAATPVGLPVKPVPTAKPTGPTPGEQLKNLDDEMFVRQNAPDPNDAAFQGAVQQLQPQPQRI